jgi:WXG100 family type VII secretion target
MEATAKKFEAGNDSLQRMLSKLLLQLEALQTQWQGEGGRSFTQVKQAWAENQQKIQRALAETANAIRTSGQQYSASDTEAASRVAATNRGVDLPL